MLLLVKGLGMGLAVTRKYVESAGHSLALENAKNRQGARVTIIFKKEAPPQDK